MVTMHFLQVRLHGTLFVLLLVLPTEQPPVFGSHVFESCRRLMSHACSWHANYHCFFFCDEISVTIAYSVGNKNTHIDNLITWYIYMANWERNSCPWLPHARARWYGCIHANDTVQDVGCCLSVWLAAVINDKGPHTIISNYWMRLSMPS